MNQVNFKLKFAFVYIVSRLCYEIETKICHDVTFLEFAMRLMIAIYV